MKLPIMKTTKLRLYNLPIGSKLNVYDQDCTLLQKTKEEAFLVTEEGNLLNIDPCAETVVTITKDLEKRLVEGIKVQTSIMYHLSDAQECIVRGLNTQANMHINFAKILMLKYNRDELFLQSELNELWKEVKE